MSDCIGEQILLVGIRLRNGGSRGAQQVAAGRDSSAGDSLPNICDPVCRVVEIPSRQAGLLVHDEEDLRL